MKIIYANKKLFILYEKNLPSFLGREFKDNQIFSWFFYN